MIRASTLSVFAAIVPAVAGLAPGQPLKHNDLAPREISEGFILLFDGRTPFGWMLEQKAESRNLSIANGALTLTGENATIRTTSEFHCFELQFQYNAGHEAQLLLHDRKIPLPDTGGKWRQAILHARMGDGKRIVAAGFMEIGEKTDKLRELHAVDDPARTSIGFQSPAGSPLNLRSVKLKPMTMKQLFNGKDLSGWKGVPGHPSRFSVTPYGELNIKDGGGEIQTEDQWADFILQLDVISNGKHLNSGIFFRAIPGQLWQGYEAQIRNQWEGDDRAKPTDFGTGGIYNRQPARKVISTDKEWFTYTILAHGNHIATWVDGYQTADYFDNDKDAETARKGRYLGKGAIGLQGHDPTTDLSFRNIRLQELPPAKK